MPWVAGSNPACIGIRKWHNARTALITPANPAAASLLNIQWPRDDGRNLTGLVQQPGLDDIIEHAIELTDKGIDPLRQPVGEPLLAV